MRKRCKRILKYWRHSFVSFIIITLIMTAGLFVFLIMSGNAVIQWKVLKIYEESDLSDSVYFMPSHDLDNFDTEIDEKTICSFPAVSGLIRRRTDLVAPVEKSEEIIYNVTICSEAYYRSFHLADRGNWLNSDSDKNDEIDVVVSGYAFRNYKIGESFSVITGGSAEKIPLHIIGIQDEPAYQPRLGISSSSVRITDLIGPAHNDIFISDRDANKLFSTNQILSSYGCFVKFYPDATDAEISEVTDYLDGKGSYTSYSDIVQREKAESFNQNKRDFLYPLILLFLLTLLLVTVWTILIYKSWKKLEPLLLSGYSERDRISDAFISMSIIIFFPSLLNTLFIGFFPLLFDSGLVHSFSYNGMLYMGSVSVIILWSYFLVCLGLLLLIILFAHKRKKNWKQ